MCNFHSARLMGEEKRRQRGKREREGKICREGEVECFLRGK